MKKWILLFFKGMAMGASDVVPGVSGGTIAFITGIYERLIHAIKSINFANLKLFFKGQFKEFWQNIDGWFLVCVVAGIGVSFLSLAKLITMLLNAYPQYVWSFFFGLILASTIFVGRDVKWNWKTILAFILFAVLSFFITSPENSPLAENDSYWYIFLCGAVAICAMILPGISGSFILVLLGQYTFMLTALTELQIAVILVFAAGALIGIVSFSHVLNWLFTHFKQITLAALTGFMFGSLNKIWPWKETLETFIDRHGEVKPLIQSNILPQINSEFWLSIIMIIAGLALIFVIELIAKKMHETKPAQAV
ncbi:MAG: DUF368 domain-containing protein [Bacteroidales bacterium]|nr:DUF368 domain-containing protein [Bacteroidales bacterium]